MYHTAHSFLAVYGGCAKIVLQPGAAGVVWDNSSSVQTVHDSSSFHPWFAKILAAHRDVLAAQGQHPHTGDVPGSPHYSNAEAGLEAEFISAADMQQLSNESK